MRYLDWSWRADDGADHAWDGVGYEWTQLEVAEVLGISNSSVQRHSERAIARLRRVRRDPECPACAEEDKPPRLVEYDIACAHPGSVARIA
jgi:hypothetical protein